MAQPEVSLENAEAVYDYYLEHKQNRLLAMSAYALLARRYQPRVSYADGVQQQLAQLVKSDRRLVVLVNHLTQRDPYTVAAVAWRSPLRPTIGRVRVLAKDELFIDPKQRQRVEMMGAIPVFRGKNYGIRQVNAAGQRMMDVCAERMRRGDDLAIFPEGTCNDVDPAQVQAVGSGVGHITARAMKLGVAPTFVFIGVSYGPGVPTEPAREQVRSASFFIDTPTDELPERPGDIARMVRTRLQAAVDGAIARY
ncbi:1-acyl-sn-glycerol-3-phosphate acyltransferase [Skermania sp. ID1734]|uniref:lysophospholipid acyltransferase family protein n=1 Tax=Skermania sp. ID1734 TaxID=2597516 RepID=UPI00117C9569|nr:1-acyl-sn-glycerol-3-phosphate acyltransferase [Skermania sp. ID1734]TSE00283.1 1-acyl-sn-glycerol-3-phosphate acyltransferase [Skermania sp. ID1734]